MCYRVIFMSRIWDTKKRILDMLSSRKMTLTELSDRLGLAPSTINQHLRELLDAGAIRQVNNPFILKWKYYEANPEFNGTAAVRRSEGNLMSNPIFKVVPIIAVLAVATFVLLGTGSGTALTSAVDAQQVLAPGSVPQGVTVFSLSDAPAISSISAVDISVSSAYVHSMTTGKWYMVFSSNTPKSFDLVQLRNVAGVLSGANLSAGTYDEITLTVSNATAVVNNQTEPVFLPSGELKIFGKFDIGSASNTVVNSTNSSNTTGSNTVNWINLDFNLSKSIHITGNGKVILLPVISLNGRQGAELNVSTNGTLVVHKPGRLAIHEQVGMDDHGNMQAGVPVPMNANLSVENETESENGSRSMHNGDVNAVIISNPHIASQDIPIAIRTRDHLIVITNETNMTAITSGFNISENETVKVVGPMHHNESMNCTAVNGSVSCQASGEIEAGDLGSIIAANASGVFHSGKGEGSGNGEGGSITGIINSSTTGIINSSANGTAGIGIGIGEGSGGENASSHRGGG